MRSAFVDMLLKKSAPEQPPALPELDEAEFCQEPTLEIRQNDDGGHTYLVTIGRQQYSFVNDEYYVLVRAVTNGTAQAYWRKVNVAATRIMRQIDEVIERGCKNA